MNLLCSLVAVFPSPTTFGTVFHFIPTISPFFAPSKRTTTDGAYFSWQVRFRTLACHVKLFELQVVNN